MPTSASRNEKTSSDIVYIIDDQGEVGERRAMEISERYSFRFAAEILDSVDSLSQLWREIDASIRSISDDDLVERHTQIQEEESTKSLSKAINQLLDERLRSYGWQSQSGIFSTSEYEEEISSTWTLDFSKSTKLADGELSGIAIEVAFNHSEAAAWNLTKPMLAAEINDVRVQTNIGEGVGVVIVASPELKRHGAFDRAIGDFNRYRKTIRAMRNVLTVPILLVGLAAPRTFRIQAKSQANSPYKSGQVIYISN